MFGHAINTYLMPQQLDIVHKASDRPLSNGLAESHWKMMVHMSRAYFTEKQMSHDFWFNLFRRAAQIMSSIPTTYNNCLASPVMLVHGTLVDSHT